MQRCGAIRERESVGRSRTIRWRKKGMEDDRECGIIGRRCRAIREREISMEEDVGLFVNARLSVEEDAGLFVNARLSVEEDIGLFVNARSFVDRKCIKDVCFREAMIRLAPVQIMQIENPL